MQTIIHLELGLINYLHYNLRIIESINNVQNLQQIF